MAHACIPSTWKTETGGSQFFFFLVLGMELRSILPRSYTPSPIFCSFFFETGSHWDYKCMPPRPAYSFFFFFLWYRGFNPGVFYLRATPPALFFFLYFILKPGLMKLQRTSLSRERERELRLATNLDPPVSASQSTGITSVHHHTQLYNLCFNKPS